MSGDDFDPCECIFNHESSMQRLLNMLRQSQGYCNDVVCQTDSVNPLAGNSSGDGGIPVGFVLVFAWLLVTLGLFAFRNTGINNGDNKPRPSGVSSVLPV